MFKAVNVSMYTFAAFYFEILALEEEQPKCP